MREPLVRCVGLLVLLGFSACHAPSGPSGAQENGPTADQTIQGFTIDSFSREGQTWSLTAPRADVFEKDHRIEIVQPSVRFYKNNEKSSDLNADHGRINSETRDIWLWDNVVMVSTDGVKLTTDFMSYVSAINRVISTAPVVIEREGSVIHGEGWEANPDLSEIVIQKQKIELDDRSGFIKRSSTEPRKP